MQVRAAVQLTHSSTNRQVDVAEQSGAAATLADPDGRGSVALVVSCVGRRPHLGQRTDEEREAERDAQDGTPVVGRYSCGELTTAPGSGCRLADRTMTAIVLRERATA